ncbi:MAG: transposase [Ectothiorhodospiraceae bacterium]
MPYPRHAQVSTQTTPYYHCVSRCVRRAFLCGWDRVTGRSYELRKQWVVDRIRRLGEVFCIDICAYAVMSDHHHVSVRLNPEEAEALSDDAVLTRWSELFDLPVYVERYRQGWTTGEAEAEAARAQVATYRERLSDLSWFMRCLNEPVARWANAEDGVTGRSWEGRFKSQALLDEAALIMCMSYVDLNPVRAGMVATPEASDYTAIQARIRALHDAPDACAEEGAWDRDEPAQGEHATRAGPALIPFRGLERRDVPDQLPFAFRDYLELIDWAGRAVRHDKRGAIAAEAPAILVRLGIDPDAYLDRVRHQRPGFVRAMGRAEKLRDAATELGQRFLKGITEANALFPAASG